jgi:phosphoribosylanthranilate isomerase
MKVKVCGITNLEDAMQAITSGADALGFVFYPESPRYITPKDAKAIIDQLPPFVEKVGLFVNHCADETNEIATESGITLAQIHFEAEDDYYQALTIPHIKVIRAQSAEDIQKYTDEYRLVDAYVEEYGGAGKRVNLEWFEGIDTSKIILAGGLSPDNVQEITANHNFYGVDASSSLERAKGLKDHTKVTEFIQRAKGVL